MAAVVSAVWSCNPRDDSATFPEPQSHSATVLQGRGGGGGGYLEYPTGGGGGPCGLVLRPPRWLGDLSRASVPFVHGGGGGGGDARGGEGAVPWWRDRWRRWSVGFGPAPPPMATRGSWSSCDAARFEPGDETAAVWSASATLAEYSSAAKASCALTSS